MLKKVVPAITDICTGGQRCKYQLLGSGVNISYYLHGGEFCCYCSKKIWRNADITLKFCTHIHLGIMKQQLNLQPDIWFIYPVNPVLHTDILTQIYNNEYYHRIDNFESRLRTSRLRSYMGVCTWNKKFTYLLIEVGYTCELGINSRSDEKWSTYISSVHSTWYITFRYDLNIPTLTNGYLWHISHLTWAQYGTVPNSKTFNFTFHVVDKL